MKNILFILTITFSLFAQYTWSEPVQISETGNSEFGYSKPVIAIDDSSTISVFWVKINYGVNKHIEWIQSADNGLSWSEPVSITPEFTDDRIWDLRAVCDSENNVYMFYHIGLGFDTNSIICKKYNGIEWSEPDTLTSLASHDLFTAVDNEDRIYVFWGLNGIQYYTYSDKSDNRIWLEPMIFENTQLNTVITNNNIIFDDENNLYVTGNLTGDFKGLRPGLFSYSKSEEKWNDIEEIGSFTSTSSGCALALSSDSVLTANVSVGTTIDEGDNYIISKKLDTVAWTPSIYLNRDTNIYTRKMFCDKNDNIHLIEQYVIDIRRELVYSYSCSNTWTTETIQADENKTFGYLDVAMNDNSDMLFIVFTVYDYLNSYATTNYFQFKLIETGIEEANAIKGFELYQNYPNPFNSSTQITYSIPQAGEVSLSVFNVKGELVKAIANSRQSMGQHSVTFEASNLNSGIYYYRLEVDGILSDSKRMLYLK